MDNGAMRRPYSHHPDRRKAASDSEAGAVECNMGNHLFRLIAKKMEKFFLRSRFEVKNGGVSARSPGILLFPQLTLVGQSGNLQRFEDTLEKSTKALHSMSEGL